MRFPRSVSVDDLPRAQRRTSGSPGRLSRWAWSLSGRHHPRPAFDPVVIAGPELFAARLNPAADLSGLRPDHFLHHRDYASVRFVQGVGRDIAFTRVAKAVGGPGRGFIDEFNVGGGLHIPEFLLEADLLRDADATFVADAGSVEHVPGASVPFCHYGYTAFGHFVMDGLLQIHLWEKALQAGDAKLAHWPLQEPWMQPALSACGLPARAQRELNASVAVLQQASLSSALAGHGVYYPAAYSRRFFQWLAAKFVAEPVRGPQKLYVRRFESSGRAISNSAELEALAVSCGFEVFDPREHSFADQVRLFSGAGTVLSAWGSTLTLAPLLTGERRVIELLPDSVTDLWFLRQAAVHELDYLPMVQAAHGDGGFAADLAALEGTLAALERGQSQVAR